MKTLEQIDQYLDRKLAFDEAVELEQTLQTEPHLQELFESVAFTRDAIRSSTLRTRVQGLHLQLLEEVKLQETAELLPELQTSVRPLRYNQPWRWSARIAASGLLLLAGYGSYKYGATNIDSYYGDKYVSYQLPTHRGDSPDKFASLDALYKAGNFAEVVRRFDGLLSPTAHEQFLTGMAHLQQQEYEQAINKFVALRKTNDLNNKPLFDQETDYYLALAYLGTGRIADAYPLFEKINKTPRHLYKQNVTDQDLVKLGLLRWKNN